MVTMADNKDRFKIGFRIVERNPQHHEGVIYTGEPKNLTDAIDEANKVLTEKFGINSRLIMTNDHRKSRR